SDEVCVKSRAFGSEEAFCWVSGGAEGYSIEPCEKDSVGTTITVHIKENTETENYDEYLEEYRITSIIKKYSDFIRYPINMMCETRQLKEGTESEYETIMENKVLNSMTPLWKKDKKDITKEEYDSFYTDHFSDYQEPAKTIHYKVEGQATYNALLYIPKHAP
ncbi:MAG: molecular chaperone HtpG, partial [Oscillospiraceae bacterium]